MEGAGVQYKVLPERLAPHLDLLTRLQCTHDINGTMLESWLDFQERQWKEVAEEFNLEMPDREGK